MWRSIHISVLMPSTYELCIYDVKIKQTSFSIEVYSAVLKYILDVSMSVLNG